MVWFKNVPNCDIIQAQSFLVDQPSLRKAVKHVWCVFNHLKHKQLIQSWSEPQHDKTNNTACAPSKVSNHQSLLCAQQVAKDKSFFMQTAKTLIRLGGCPGWSESSLGTHAILLALSCKGSFINLFHTAFVSCLQWIQFHIIPWLLSPTHVI